MLRFTLPSLYLVWMRLLFLSHKPLPRLRALGRMSKLLNSIWRSAIDVLYFQRCHDIHYRVKRSMTWKVRSIKEFWNIASVILVDKGLPTSEGCINLIVVAVEAQVVVTIANLYKRIISWELVAENCSQEVVNFLNVLAKLLLEVISTREKFMFISTR
ncbi:hypothetical protein Bca4012_063524 [Brassica carinata]